MSLYEVSDIIVDQSFRARDLVRGGEPVLISERLATRSLKQWDRFAGRVVQVGKQMQISGAVLPYEYETSKELIRGLRSIGKLTKKAGAGPRQGHRRGLRCCSNRAALRQRKAARDKRHLYDLLAYRRDRPHHAGHS
jgi:hypothetical protein